MMFPAFYVTIPSRLKIFQIFLPPLGDLCPVSITK